MRNELYQLLKEEGHVLPIEFCKEVLFAYEMYEEALMMLYYKKDYTGLINTVKTQFNANSSNK